MKQIVAIVKPFRAADVLREVGRFDIETVRVLESRGYGRQKDRLPRYLGSEYSTVYLPKIEIHILVRDALVEQIVDCITQVARTGRIGDGKILVLPVIGAVEF
jgi:nitrogen regulatory protein PII